MSPRPLRLRKVSNPPVISGFKPYGVKNNNGNAEAVFLHFEEYEALRLCDYELLNHHQASLIMEVSRPTLTRIYARARQKLAEAFVMGKQIIIEGGKIYFDNRWFVCNTCGCYFNNPDKQEEVTGCPLCGSKSFSGINDVIYESEESAPRYSALCICPECGYEQDHHSGKSCKAEICPGCGHYMIRKDPVPIKTSTKKEKHESSDHQHGK